MIVDGGGDERPHEPVVERHIPDRQQKWRPLLVEGDDGQHREEVEVQLNVAARQVHQHRGGGDEAAAREHSPGHAAEPPPGGRDGERRDGRPVGEAMCPPLLGEQSKGHDAEGVEPQQHENAPMPTPPELIGQRVPYG